jgi:hypothetical protein
VSTGTDNIAIGFQSGYSVTTGTGNIIIGNQSGKNIKSGSNNVFIGSETQGSTISTSNEIVISTNSSTGKGVNTAFIDASNGLYQTNPVLAQFPVINSTCDIGNINNNYPYYSYANTSTGDVTYFNRGVILTTFTSGFGGSWQFNQTGLYKITVTMNQTNDATGKTTFVGSVQSLGGAITYYGNMNWNTNGSQSVGWTFVTLINVTNLTLNYIVGERSSISITSSLNGKSSVLIEMLSVN